MRMLAAVLALSLVAPAAVPPADAADGRRGGHAARRGLLPVPEIERRVVPRVPGAQYLGFDFDPDSAIYTLKFLREGNMIWVEVDGRTGQIIGRSGR